MMALFMFGLQAKASVCEDFLKFSWQQSLDTQWAQSQKLFSKRQQKLWSEAMGHIKDDFSVDRDQLNGKNQSIKTEYLKALKILPIIVSHKSKNVYFKEIYAAIWATLSVHTHELIDAQNLKGDFPRYFKILKNIQEFDPADPEFSLYKIKRSIEGRFSLKEYVNCN